VVSFIGRLCIHDFFSLGARNPPFVPRGLTPGQNLSRCVNLFFFYISSPKQNMSRWVFSLGTCSRVRASKIEGYSSSVGFTIFAALPLCRRDLSNFVVFFYPLFPHVFLLCNVDGEVLFFPFRTSPRGRPKMMFPFSFPFISFFFWPFCHRFCGNPIESRSPFFPPA